MNADERARLVRLERKAFRARRLPQMARVDAAGLSTKPWGARRPYGIGFSVGNGGGPSKPALQAWERATGGIRKPQRPRGMRRPRRPFFG